MDEEQIKNNIRRLLIAIAICAAVIALLMVINRLISKNNTTVNSAQAQGEIIDDDQEYSLGEIEEDVDDPETSLYPMGVSTGSPELTGTKASNINQNINGYYGTFAYSEDYIAYTDFSSGEPLLCLLNQITGESAAIGHYDARYLCFYDGFLIGIYNKNYGGTSQKDVIFLYSIDKERMTTYDSQLGDEPSRNITSMVTDGNYMYWGDSESGCIYKIQFNGEGKELVTKIQRSDSSEYPVIFNLKDGLLYFSVSGECFCIDVESGIEDNLNDETVTSLISDDVFDLSYNVDDNEYIIYRYGQEAYSGQLNSFGTDGGYAFFSVGGRLYQLGETLDLLGEMDNDIISLFFGDYEIFIVDSSYNFSTCSKKLDLDEYMGQLIQGY